MATITYKSLTALQPVELNYDFYKTELLQKDTESFVEGYNFVNLKSLQNFQDVAINKNTCFVLTTSISLSAIFEVQSELSIGQIPGSVNLLPQNSTIYFIGNDTNRDIITLSLTPQNIFITPLGNNEIELRIGNLYLQFDESYPYQVRANNLLLDEDQLYRRKFRYIYQNNLLSIIAQTKDGDRYLAFGADNVLRATGIILGNNAINNYVFKVQNVTNTELTYNFEPENKWVTYYLDFTSQTENTTLTINKKINTPTNFLFSFPVQAKNIQNVNIANLKTGYTPTGSPTPIDNSYSEEIITAN